MLSFMLFIVEALAAIPLTKAVEILAARDESEL
jgi:hypothetical protein